MDPPGIEPGHPDCEPGILPFNHEPDKVDLPRLELGTPSTPRMYSTPKLQAL